MARVFITGSADGLGLLSAKALISQGHKVVLHARNEARRSDTTRQVPDAEAVLVADLSSVEETRKLAADVNALGEFDAVIHNAGVYRESPAITFRVNTLAPYILSCLIHKPKRLIYLSSALHQSGKPSLDQLERNPPGVSYSDSKLHDVMLSMAIARKWKDVYSNAVDPGWVPTRMGGSGAPDDLAQGAETQAWLAVSDEEKAKVSGRYFFHKKQRSYNPLADDTNLQDKLLRACETITGVSLN